MNLVLRIMEAYSAGYYSAVPSGTYAGQFFTPAYTTAAVTKKTRGKSGHANAAAAAPGAAGAGAGGGAAAGTPPPAAEKPAKAPTSGLLESVDGLVKSPTQALPSLVPDVLSKLEATTTCIQSGVNALDLPGLAGCVLRLLG
ncbi:hypothetical protein [Nocardioides marmoriginsengisoli]|uniref:hypothetical protein n=1 Tax=Nocardioides marmoriginsengisoli TaxID=661483 RepID=UPI0011CE4F10|nr:hypothetical protein [Nocardioides marmoriginsengisoli]